MQMFLRSFARWLVRAALVVATVNCWAAATTAVHEAAPANGAPARATATAEPGVAAARAAPAVGAATAAGSPAAATAPTPRSSRRPNVVLILADDLGYADVSAGFAGRFPTPNIDRIGAEGVRFTAGYVAAPVCSPSRAALITGRYPQRFGFEFNDGPAERDVAQNLGLDPGEYTLGDLMQRAGYRTGLVGKWHLGANADYYPTSRGFDEFFGFLPGAMPYINTSLPGVLTEAPSGAARRVTPNETRGARIYRGARREVVDVSDRYLTDDFASEAEAFIGRNAQRPFFLYLAFNAPHAPLQVTQKYYDRFPNIANQSRRVYAGMVSALDDGVGRVLEALQKAGIADNTLVIFLSDNGCAVYAGGFCSCEPFRGGKLSHFEGGVRVPFMVRWPGHIAPGTVHEQPVSALDVVPTVLAAAGAKPGKDRPLDGLDLLPQLASPNAPARPLFWWREPLRSVRDGDWKLWVSENGDIRYLFNLAEDSREQHNLYSSRPDKVAELQAKLRDWHADKVPPAWSSRRPVTYTACGVTQTLPF